MTNGERPEAGPDGLHEVRDRPWLVRPAGPPDESRIRDWQQEVDRRHQLALRRLAAEERARWSDDLVPGISVVVLATSCLTAVASVGPAAREDRGHLEDLARLLHRLAGQSLDHARFEIIVVAAGPADRPIECLADFRRTNPSIGLRLVLLTASGAAAGAASAARTAGIAAARRQHTTFVRAADQVSARFLEVLLANAAPAAIPVASVVEAGAPGTGAPPVDLAAASGSDLAKAAPTGLLRELSEDPDLADQSEPVFWLTLLVRGGMGFLPCPEAGGAVYYRNAGGARCSDSEPAFDTAVARTLDTVQSLEALTERADVGTRRLLRDQVGASADRLGSYLRRQPDGHSRVVAALDRRRVFYFPYERMNGDRARSLAIAYAFPPYADTSAVVTAKRVRARGQLVDVICNAMDRIRQRDDSLQRISGPYVAYRAALSTPSYFSDWPSMERFAQAGLKVVEEWVAHKGHYHDVYSRAHFAASHFLAAAYKVRNPQVRWRAEFSDPLSRDVTGQERGTPVTEGGLLADLGRGLQAAGFPRPATTNCFVWCEQLAYALADELVFTNQYQLEYMLDYCQDRGVAAMVRAKAVISPQPTLPAEFYSTLLYDYPLEDGVVHLAYFGNFYATRGLDDVLAALAVAGPVTQSRLRVHVFTSKPAELRKRVHDVGIADLVRVAPFVRYLEFLSLATRFDCLIANDALTAGSHACNPYLPSKWADYRGSGTPVWGLVEPGSELSGLPLDYSSPIGDIDSVGDVLSLIATSAPRTLLRRDPDRRG